MAEIKIQKIPTKSLSAQEIIGAFCYHFPQYTYKQAQNLPYKKVVFLLKVARKEHAKKMMDIARIMGAANSGKGMKDVLSYFKSILEE